MFSLMFLDAVPRLIRDTSDRVGVLAAPQAISWITSVKFAINKSQQLAPTYGILRPPIIIIIIIIIITYFLYGAESFLRS